MPKHNFDIINEEFIRDEMGEFFLLRRIKYDKKQPDPRKRLKDQFIPTTFKKGISVLLLSVLRKEDVCWCCRKPYGKTKHYEDKWIDYKKKTVFPKNKHLHYEKKATFSGYMIKELYQYESEYPIMVKDRYGRDVERKDLIKLKVVHEPVCINYWHFEIMIYRLNGFDTKKEEKISNKEMGRIGNLLIEDLVDSVYEPDATEPKYLEKKHYKMRHLAV